MAFARRQRRAAFDEVVSHYEAALLRYASRLLSNENSAQDVVQNALIKLFKRWEDKMEPSPALSSWLYRVVHNEAVDLVRKESRRWELHKRQAAERPISSGPNRGCGLHISGRAELAAAALQVLPERDRQVVILKVYEEMSYREISEITGLSSGNVGYILHHAMKRLAAELKRLEQDED